MQLLFYRLIIFHFRSIDLKRNNGYWDYEHDIRCVCVYLKVVYSMKPCSQVIPPQVFDCLQYANMETEGKGLGDLVRS